MKKFATLSALAVFTLGSFTAQAQRTGAGTLPAAKAGPSLPSTCAANSPASAWQAID